jgi:GDSL-like Lipase/Acylhydrolase family
VRRNLKIVFVNVLFLAGGLVIVELTFGNWLRPRSRIARLNFLVNTTVMHDVTSLYRDGDRTAIYKRDGFGFRGVYPDPAHIDILTIGGSTTDQRYITEGKTWQDVLANEFRLAGRNVSVVNAGIDGQTTYGHLKDFEWWFPFVPGLRVRYFLFYVGYNDVFLDGKPTTYDAPEPRTGFRSVLFANSALYHLLHTLKGIYLARRYGLGHSPVRRNVWHSRDDFAGPDWTTVPRQREYELMRNRLPAYRQRLAALLERSRRFGGEPICVTQPSRYFKKVDGVVFGRADVSHFPDGEINGVDFYYLLEMMNAATLAVCRGSGAVAVDLANGVAWEDADFYDRAHNTPRGAEKIGRYLYRNLERLF